MGSSVCVDGLAKSFRMGGRTVRILGGVTFDALPDTITAIIGPNACGKTTVLRLLAGIIAPDSGKVEIDGVDLYSDLTTMRRKVGFVSPALGFHKKLTMAETLSYFEGIQGSSRETVLPFLRTMGMEEVLDEKIEGFSEGQKMVLRISCALMKKPSLLLLDEVTSPLDTERAARLIAFLKELSSATTVIMIDHNPRVIGRLADRFVLMRKNGTVMKTGEMHAFFKSASHRFRLRVKPHDSVHPEFWDSFSVPYEMGEDGSVSFLLESREKTNELMDEIAKYSGSVHSYEAAVVTLVDVYEEWIRMAEHDKGNEAI